MRRNCPLELIGEGGKVLKYYASTKEAAADLHVVRDTIYKWLSGYTGYARSLPDGVWLRQAASGGKPVALIDEDGNVLRRWPTVDAAVNNTKIYKEEQ